MTTATAETAKKISQNSKPMAGESLALDRRYRQIGISAVAAAVRYQGGTKNPAYAPVPIKWRDRNDAA